MLSGTGEYIGALQAKPTFPADDSSKGSSEGPKLREMMTAVKNIYVKMHDELAMAKREIAWGKLSAKDIGHTSDLCRRILMPM